MVNIINFIGVNKTLKIILIVLGTYVLNFLLIKAIRLPNRITTQRAQTLFSFIKRIISIIIYIISLLLLFSVFGINITPFIASAGIIGIAVGLGSQALIRDIIAGIFLLAENTISIGDMVEIGDHRGIVRKVGIRTLILKDENGALRIIPAGRINEVINLSREEARVNIDIPIKPYTEIDKVLKIIREEIAKLYLDKRYFKLLTKKPELKGIEDLQPGKIIVRALVYSKFQHQWRIKREILYRVIRRFNNEGIELA